MNQETDLEQVIRQIGPLDEHAMEQAKKQWNSIAKPLHSLGKLEEHIIRIAGITGDPDVKIEEKALIVMCADNGVVEEGVTQTGQEVTAIVMRISIRRNQCGHYVLAGREPGSFLLTLAWQENKSAGL